MIASSLLASERERRKERQSERMDRALSKLCIVMHKCKVFTIMGNCIGVAARCFLVFTAVSNAARAFQNALFGNEGFPVYLMMRLQTTSFFQIMHVVTHTSW